MSNQEKDLERPADVPTGGGDALERVNAITARERSATEGPWAIWHDLDHQGFKTVGDAASYDEVKRDGFTEESNPTAHVYTEEDAEFIAHARQDVPWLLAENARLVEQLHAAEAERDARAEDARLYNVDVAKAVDERDRAEAEVAARDAVIEAIRNWRALEGPVGALGAVPIDADAKDNWLLNRLLRDAPESVLRERDAEVAAKAWDEGATWAAIECGAIARPENEFLTPGDNPYREGAEQ